MALDAELHREVALKQILDRHADDPTSRQRFLLEAEITGGLEHPGIVPVYGLGTYGDGRPYYAMRFIRGDSLKEAIDALPRRRGAEGATRAAGRWSCASCCGGSSTSATRSSTPTAGACCTATSSRATSSSASTARRWSSTGAWPRPTGRAEPGAGSEERTLMPSSASGSAETLPGSALGTPAYMSPEQAAGDLDRLGPRSPTSTASGATLYCLLTGRPPFEGDDVGAVLRAVQQGEFPPPRQARPDDRPGAGGGLPQGDGPRARGPLRLAAGRWPRTSSGGWPTSRSRPSASRSRGGPAAGRGGTGRR